ncbi:MAG: hypothetical protein JRI36_13815, partial [Deltaproteobacteria bacterium]|nr:hypothetical protein [Deltaproteobacteria bacterium]
MCSFRERSKCINLSGSNSHQNGVNSRGCLQCQAVIHQAELWALEVFLTSLSDSNEFCKGHKVSRKLENMQEVRIGKRGISLRALKGVIEDCPDVVAAYLFGSAAQGAPAVNDLDILVLLRKEAEKDKVYVDLICRLCQALQISEDRIDLLFLDLKEADLIVLSKAI